MSRWRATCSRGLHGRDVALPTRLERPCRRAMGNGVARIAASLDTMSGCRIDRHSSATEAAFLLSDLSFRHARPASDRPLQQQLLGLGDRLGGVQALGADVGAVHDRVAAVEAERVLELVEPLAGRLVAAVGEPAIGLEQDRRARGTCPNSTNSSGRRSSSRRTGCTRRGRPASRGPRATAAAPCPTAVGVLVFSQGSIEAYWA